MNDRNIGLLDNYDIEVLRTWKGRGALCCEAGDLYPEGIYRTQGEGGISGYAAGKTSGKGV